MKFQCKECQGIIVVDFEGDMVNCGICDAVCKVPAPFSEGVVIDDFLILNLLGAGGMGNVYLAHEFSLDRKVALKILKDSISLNTEIRNSFIKEARSVASLNHPNIIQAYKVGLDEEGILFFAMEYVEGQTLQDLQKQNGMLDEKLVLDIAFDTVTALSYAWDKRKLVHRDIKPENIMISNEDGRTKLMDLGLSCHAGESDADEDQISGTPQYISPEQIMGTDIDIRTDFYCLGATLYHLLSGTFPFNGNLQEIVKQHLSASPRSLKRHRPDLSDNTVKIIHRLMKKSPDERYSSAEKLLKDLTKAKNLITNALKSKKHISIKPAEVKTHAKIERSKNRKDDGQKKKVLTVLGLILLVTFGGILLLANKMLNPESPKPKKDNVAKTETKKTQPKIENKGLQLQSIKAAPVTSSQVKSAKTNFGPSTFSSIPILDSGLVHQYSFDSPENFPEIKNSLLAIDKKSSAHLIVMNTKINDGFLIYDSTKFSKAKLSGKLKAKFDESFLNKNKFFVETLFRCDNKTIRKHKLLNGLLRKGDITLDPSKYYYFAQGINQSDSSSVVYFGIVGEKLVHARLSLSKEQMNQFNYLAKNTLMLSKLLGMEIFTGEIHELRIWNRYITQKDVLTIVGVEGSLRIQVEDLNIVNEEEVIVQDGAEWHHFTGAKAPIKNWFSKEREDSWTPKPTPMGYGEDGVKSIINKDRLIHYFKKPFSLEEVQDLTLNVKFDDGCVIYVNGQELKRYNMPEGQINDSTAALRAVRGPDSKSVTTIPASMLKVGENLIGISVHNRKLSSSDLFFAPELIVK